MNASGPSDLQFDMTADVPEDIHAFVNLWTQRVSKELDTVDVQSGNVTTEVAGENIGQAILAPNETLIYLILGAGSG